MTRCLSAEWEEHPGGIGSLRGKMGNNEAILVSDETPEDIATLYSWANLHGAKYRDFSATRARVRETARQRVLEAMETERKRTLEEAAAQDKITSGEGCARNGSRYVDEADSGPVPEKNSSRVAVMPSAMPAGAMPAAMPAGAPLNPGIAKVEAEDAKPAPAVESQPVSFVNPVSQLSSLSLPSPSSTACGGS